MSEELNMNEENRKQNSLPQLSDAALEGVSGGGSGNPRDPATNAADCCSRCGYKRGCGHYDDLIHYLKENGYISNATYCPFYPKKSYY